MTTLFVGHSPTSSRGLTALDAGDGGTLWNTITANVLAVAVDGEGHVLFGGDAINLNSVTRNLEKFTVAGTRITDGWPIYHNNSTDAINGIAVDADDAVYVAVTRSSSSSRPVAKYAAAGGSPVWIYGASSTMRSVSVDSEGFIVYAGNEGGNIALRKWTDDGSALNSTNHGVGVHLYAVATPGTDIIAAGDFNTSDSPQNNIRRYEKASFGDNFNSTAIWKREYLNARIRGLAVDSSDNIYVVGLKNTGNGTLKKYNSAGTLQWSADHGADTRAIALDEANGFVYIGGTRFDGYGVRKYTLDGTQITTGGWPWAVPSGVTVNALAIYEPPPVPVPGLPLPLDIGLPLSTFGHTAGGVLAPLSLALPTATEPSLPPIAPARTIYELWIGAGSESVRLPVVEFQCRRRRNDSTWLAVRLSGIDRAAWLRGLGAAPVRLYAGDGATMGEFLRATLTAVDDEQAAWSATTTLTCRAEAPADPLQTRTLSGIEKIVIDNGRRFVRCNQVDFRLRPGDYAVADGNTFLVYGVNYRIGAGVAIMDVRESP